MILLFNKQVCVKSLARLDDEGIWFTAMLFDECHNLASSQTLSYEDDKGKKDWKFIHKMIICFDLTLPDSSSTLRKTFYQEVFFLFFIRESKGKIMSKEWEEKKKMERKNEKLHRGASEWVREKKVFSFLLIWF